jgi:hypothetical protein
MVERGERSGGGTREKSLMTQVKGRKEVSVRGREVSLYVDSRVYV